MDQAKLSARLRQIFRDCVLEQKMELPLIVCSASKNGTTLVVRVHSDGLPLDVVVAHFEEGGFVEPISCTVLSQNGAAAHVTIEADTSALQ